MLGVNRTSQTQRLKLRMEGYPERYGVSMRPFNDLAFCSSPLHARAPKEEPLSNFLSLDRSASRGQGGLGPGCWHRGSHEVGARWAWIRVRWTRAIYVHGR